MTAAVDGSDTSGLVAITAEQIAANIAANVAVRWSPSTCASVSQTGADISITYDDCTGPRGLVHVTGELDLAVTVDLAGIHVHGAATNFDVNQAVLDIDADALYATNGTGHTLTVSTKGSGTGRLGNDIDHNGNYTVTWDSSTQCRSIAGSWSTELTTTAATATRSNDVSLARCAAGCPTGTVTHHYLGGASITVTFDGTATATWTASTGRSGSVALACGT